MFSYDKAEKATIQRTSDISHRIAMCPVIKDGQPCGFYGFARNAAMDHHHCPLLMGQPRLHPTVVSQSEAVALTVANHSGPVPEEVQAIRKSLLIHLLNCISGTSASYSLISSQGFTTFCRELIQQARAYPHLSPSQIAPQYTIHAISSGLVAYSQQLFHTLLDTLHSSSVCLIIDSSKIIHRHFLAIGLCPYTRSSGPLYFQLCPSPKSLSDYCDLYKELYKFLKQYDIEIGSICTDGLPAQISAVKEFRKWLLKERNQNPTLIPIHIPCFNHRVNLVTQSLLKGESELRDTVDTIQGFASQSHNNDFKQKLRHVCPSFIPTRWLTAHMIASFIRLHRDDIAKARLLPSSKLIQILKLEIILTPLMELQIYFEDENTRLCDAFPAILRALQQYQLLLSIKTIADECSQSILKCMIMLFNGTLSGYIGKLLLLSWALTPLGRILFSQNNLLSAYSVSLSLSEAKQLEYVSFLSVSTLFQKIVCR